MEKSLKIFRILKYSKFNPYRYLDSVSMNMLTLSDGVDLICLIQQAMTEF